MKIIVESIHPFLSYKSSNNNYEYYVKHWNVTGYTWDGDCMCTKKIFNLKLEHHELIFSKIEVLEMLKELLK